MGCARCRFYFHGASEVSLEECGAVVAVGEAAGAASGRMGACENETVRTPAAVHSLSMPPDCVCSLRGFCVAAASDVGETQRCCCEGYRVCRGIMREMQSDSKQPSGTLHCFSEAGL